MKQANEKIEIARGRRAMNPNGRVRAFGTSRDNIGDYKKGGGDELVGTVERKFQIKDEDDPDLFTDDDEENKERLEKKKREKKRIVVLEYGRQEMEETYHKDNLLLKEMFDGMVSEHEKLTNGKNDEKKFLEFKDYWECELADSIINDLSRREEIREYDTDEEVEEEKTKYLNPWESDEYYAEIDRENKPLRDEAEMWAKRWHAKNQETRLWKDGRVMSYETRFAEMLDERERSFE